METKQITLRPDQRAPELTQEPGDEAKAFSLAQSVIAEAKGIQNAWLRYTVKAWALNNTARELFVKELRKHASEMNKHVKAVEQTAQHDVYKGAKRSALVQISNLMSVAKAFNAGYVLELVPGAISTMGDPVPVNPFYTIVAESRLFLESAASGKGRPRKPWLDKLKKFILDNQPDFAQQTTDSVELVKQMAELTDKAKTSVAK